MKKNIKKNFLFSILAFLSLTIQAQKYQGSIVDAESQQSLPFAIKPWLIQMENFP